MGVSREEVTRLAALTRLRFDDEELEELTVQMNRMLEFVAQLNEVDTSDVEPLTYPFIEDHHFREDLPRPSLSRDETLRNAPNVTEGYFSVPNVLRP